MEKEYIKHLQQVKKVGTKLYIDDLHDVVPVGTILYTASPTPPNGYLICNGATVGRGTYPDLFAAIGTTYGDGDGSTTFQLPNLMDKTVWGGTGVGTEKEAGLPNIEGDLQLRAYHMNFDGARNNLIATANDTTLISGAFQYIPNAGSTWEGVVAQTPNSARLANTMVNLSAERDNPIYGNSDTVQPPATVLLPVIKAFGHIANPGDLDAAKLAQDMLGYLPLSGGTMTGNIVLPNGGYIGRPANSSNEVLLASSAKNTGDDSDMPDSYVSLRDSSHMTMPGVASIASRYDKAFYSIDLNAQNGELALRVNDESRYGAMEGGHYFPMEYLIDASFHEFENYGYRCLKYASGILVYSGWVTIPANWTHVAVGLTTPFNGVSYRVMITPLTAVCDILCSVGNRDVAWCDIHRRRSTDMAYNFGLTCEFYMQGYWKTPFAA